MSLSHLSLHAVPPVCGPSNAVAPVLEPRFSASERTLLREAAADCRTGLEFGAGHATSCLLEAGLARLLSVDSDAAWLARVAAEPACTAAIAEGRLRLLPVDIGPVGAWGWPAGVGRMDLWPRYWRDPWEVSPDPELVLVDGRFRVATALMAAARLPPGAAVLVHDFWSRPAYRGPLLRHFTIRDSAGGLVWLTARQPADAALLGAELAAHGFDPR